MKESRMKASTLRTTMSVIVFIIIGLMGIGFYYTQDWLSKLSLEVGQTVAQSTMGDGDTQALEQLKKDIANHQAAATRANSVVISGQDWQNQVIKDLNKYANSSGVTIANWNFDQAKAASSTAAGTSAPVLVGGVQSSTVTITLSNPVSFTSLIKFLNKIENSLPKMQLTGLSLSQSQGGGSSVTTQPLTIMVYTR